ncbi:hypothetical protein LOZ54_004583 [Ophidiomyces ophidiicola]|nr:hypothetical protein LOZ54_004583 [Ophidiomyces ophidiicola]
MSQLQFTPWKEHSQLLAVRYQFYPPPSYKGPDLRATASALVQLPSEKFDACFDGMLIDRATGVDLENSREFAPCSRGYCAIDGRLFARQPTEKFDFFDKSDIFLCLLQDARFVTGLVDSKLYGRKQTMYHKATALGVPASFVELRHEATHRELPSLAALRTAAQRSLDWLWDYYWVKLEEGILFENYPLDPSNEQVLSDSIWNIVSAMAEQRAGFSDPRKNEYLDESRSPALMINELTKICECDDRGGVFLAKALLRRGILIPESRSSTSQMNQLFTLWDGFLTEMCQLYRPFLTQFTEAMANVLVAPTSLNSEVDTYKEIVYAWFKHVLDSSSWSALRKKYLLLSYTQGLFESTTGHWAEKAQELVASCSSEEEVTLKGEVAINETDGNPVMGMVEISDESDTEMLREFGWNINRKRSFKPIGMV